jgi:signal transduction histidine kinase
LALLSHELRTPLTPALAAASYLAEHEDLLPEFREEVMAICSNVQLESRLIDDLLDLTRITRGKIELRRETVDAHRLLRDALEIARKDMEEKKIDLVMELDATFHHVWADPVRIQQVLWNLINNAVKFTNTGGRITVRTSSKKKRFRSKSPIPALVSNPKSSIVFSTRPIRKNHRLPGNLAGWAWV